jgi:hypothetical protein
MQRKFYLDNETAITVGRMAGVVLVISTLFYLLWWTTIRFDRIESMVIRSKDWSREVKELEDYQTWECTTRHRQTCTGIGDNRQCKDDSYQDCGWETHTRLINRWTSAGIYPQSPYWPSYSIELGHYERKWEVYTIRFSDDRKLYNFHPGNENDYNNYLPRQKCTVGLNWWGFVLKVACPIS